jgi:DNA-binding MarR family transcriptional regulator
MLDKMSDTSRIVERLVKKELVEKKVCDTDKRLVDVVISPTGLDVLKRLDEKNKELDAILQNLSPKEAAQLSDLLDKMRVSI